MKYKGIYGVILPLLLGYNVLTAQANLLTNGDFAAGDLSGWTTFTTVNGTLGAAFGLPEVVTFDTDGDATATNSARFQVGQVSTVPAGPAGGGILQNFVSGSGLLDISLDIAVDDSSPLGNIEAGIFRLLFNGILIDSHSFGDLNQAGIVRQTLSGMINVTAGTHELRIEMTRPFLNGDALHVTPFQYIDNVVVDAAASPVPEPSTFVLFGLGLVSLGSLTQRRRRTV